MNQLSAKRNAFVHEYLIDKNATRSAKAAGYSDKTAYSQGQRLLKNVEVAKAIKHGLQDQAEATKITAERILKRIAEYAFDGKSQRASDTLKACELLGKHFKLFTEKSEVVTQAGPQVILYSPGEISEMSARSIVNEHHGGVVIYIPDNGRSIDSPLRLKETLTS